MAEKSDGGAAAGGVPPAGDHPSTLHGLPASIAVAIRAAGGRVSFARFMELALTDAEAGYYTRGERQFGRSGDFVTVPARIPLFNRAMASLVADLVDALLDTAGNGLPVSIWEIGGGRGDMVAGILKTWDSVRPDLRPRVRWRLLDVGRHLVARQQKTLAWALAAGWTVEWGAAPDSCISEPRVVVTNELVDALPIHILDVGGDRVREAWVEMDATEEELAEVWSHPCPEALSELTELFGTVQPADIRPFSADGVVEVRPAMRDFLASIARGMGSGCVVTVDYGGLPARPALFEGGSAPDRRYQRTIRGYLRHERRHDLYSHVGRQDLTADVDFGALELHGRSLGFDCILYTTIANLTAAAGGRAEVEALRTEGRQVDGVDTSTRNGLDLDREAFYAERLLDPEDVGGLYRVMVQVRE